MKFFVLLPHESEIKTTTLARLNLISKKSGWSYTHSWVLADFSDIEAHADAFVIFGDLKSRMRQAQVNLCNKIASASSVPVLYIGHFNIDSVFTDLLNIEHFEMQHVLCLRLRDVAYQKYGYYPEPVRFAIAKYPHESDHEENRTMRKYRDVLALQDKAKKLLSKCTKKNRPDFETPCMLAPKKASESVIMRNRILIHDAFHGLLPGNATVHMSCGDPNCVHPEHIVNGPALLDTQIEEIRAAAPSSTSKQAAKVYESLAMKYGVDTVTVANVVERRMAYAQ